MPRYFFHVRMGIDWHDLEGRQLPDLEAARQEAIEAVRMIVSRASADAFNPRHCIVIGNEHGCSLTTVPFRAALKFSSSASDRAPELAESSREFGRHDGARINVNEGHELDYWREAFGCTDRQLRDAIAAVGVRAATVRDYLGRNPG